MKRWIQAAAVGLALVAATGSVRAQTDCDDKFKVLSGNWFASKLDCGADALIGAGKGAATSLAVSLAKAAVAQIAPQLASLLFGSDPFAAHAERILAEIRASEERLMRFHLSLLEDDVLSVDVPTIRTLFAELGAQTWEQKLGSFDGGTYSDLEARMVETQAALQNQGDIFGLRSLHTTANLVSWSLSFKPEYAMLTTTLGHAAHTGTPPAEFSGEEWAQIEGDAAALVLHYSDLMLDDESSGFLAYVRRLGRSDPGTGTNAFREVSDSRFGVGGASVTGDGGPFEENTVVTLSQFYVVTPLPSNADTGEPSAYFWIEVEDRSEACIEDDFPFDNCFAAGTLVVVRYIRDFETFDEFTRVLFKSGKANLLADIVTPLIDDHRYELYIDFLVASYGTLRQTIDGWYALLGRTPPQLQIDDDLEDWLAATPAVAEEVEAFVASAADTRPLARAEYRLLSNYVVAYGALGLGEIRWWMLVDRFSAASGPPLRDYLRFLADFDEPREAERHFRGTFAAKLVAVAL